MSHYEKRLARDLEAIHRQVADIGAMVHDALVSAVRAFVDQNASLASATILGDGAINRAVRECDRIAHGFVVRHLPSASHLRFVSSVLRINVALERAGDYARTVAREAAALSDLPPQAVATDVELIGRQAIRMLEQAVRAFVDGDVEQAREARLLADEVEETFQRMFDDLLGAGESHARPTKDLFAYLSVGANLERVSDQAKNICEETVFTVTGETKDPKIYRILFVDRDGSLIAPMAAAYARKAYPNSGRYDTASLNPVDRVDDRLLSFLDRQGAPPPDLSPCLLDSARASLAHYHVVVGLEPGVRDQIREMPYRTVFVGWDLNGEDGGDGEDGELIGLYRALADQVAGLMEALRGSDAD